MSRRQADHFIEIPYAAYQAMLRRKYPRPRKPGPSRVHAGKECVRLLWKAQSGRCQYCCIDLNSCRYAVDHVVALSRGGANSIFNYALACRICNLRKKAKSSTTFALQLLSQHYS